MDWQRHLNVTKFVALAVMLVTTLSVGWMIVDMSGRATEFTIISSISMNMVIMGLLVVLFLTIITDKQNDMSVVPFLMLIFTTSMIALCSSIGWYLDGDADAAMMNEINNTVQYLLAYLVYIEFWRYVVQLLDLSVPLIKRFNMIFLMLNLFGVIGVLLNPLFHHYFYISEDGWFTFTTGYDIGVLVPIVLVVFSSVIEVKYIHDRRMALAVVSFPLIVVIASVVESILGNMELIILGTLLAIMMLYGNFYLSRSKALVNKDSELIKQRAEVLVSQIQPHFLYNALTSIMNIRGTPVETRDAISDFGKYLRGNLDSLKQKGAIPIAKDYNHLDNYLQLVKLNGTPDVKLTPHITDISFLVPALTLQVLVTCCIDYNHADGRDVCIDLSITNEDDCHMIVLEDCGKGLRPMKFAEDYMVEDLTIDAVRHRLQVMVDGDMELGYDESAGVKITIRVPKSVSGSNGIAFPRM